MKPSDRMRADGVRLTDEAAAVFDIGWDSWTPAADEDVDTDLYDLRDPEYRSWDGNMYLLEERRVVRDADDLRLWLDLAGIDDDEFQTYAVYVHHVDEPGFEWLAEWASEA